jgi:hypothetical protein
MRSSTVAKRTLRLVPTRLSFKRLGILQQIEDLGVQRVAVEQPVPSKDRFKGRGRRRTVEHAAMGRRGHRNEPVSAQLKGFAEDGEREVFCVHDPTLSFEARKRCHHDAAVHR